MKRITWLILALLLCAAMPAVSADLKIGYVDLQKALNLSEAGKVAKEKIGVKVKDYEATIDARQKDLKKIKDDLEKQSLLLSEDARGAKERDYQQKLKDFQRFTKDAQEELQQKDQDFTRQILEELQHVLQDFGTKEGFTLILEKTESAVLFADDKIDVTEKLIKAYDASRKK